jgi:hypothetical protein
MVYKQQQHIFYRGNNGGIFHIFWDAPSNTLKPPEQWAGPGGLTSAPPAAVDH